MKQVLIFHGTCSAHEYYSHDYPSLSNSHWFTWLQKELLINNIQTHTPEVFEAYKPTYEKYLEELQRYKITPDTILIGHSSGGGFLLRWLSETNCKPKAVILIAPWLDPTKELKNDFFVFDLTKADNKTQIYTFYSDDDDEQIRKTFEIIKEQITLKKTVTFSDKGHFTFNDLKTQKFPELKQLVLTLFTNV